MTASCPLSDWIRFVTLPPPFSVRIGQLKIGKVDLCMILGPKVGVLPSFVAKIVGNGYCTETSVQPATVEVREYCIRVCSFREPE